MRNFKRMMMNNILSNLNEEEIEVKLSNTNLEEFIEPYLIKYPDYYNLRGDLIENLTESERIKVLKILKYEFDLT
ncbi:MAG: hypothetical protein ACFFCE_15895 [Promethearchaeota archaeon]